VKGLQNLILAQAHRRSKCSSSIKLLLYLAVLHRDDTPEKQMFLELVYQF